MASELGSSLSKLFDGLSKLCAFVLLVAYVVFAINANWTFITDATVLQAITYIMYYGPLIIVALVGMEFAVKSNILVQVVIFVLIAAVIIFQFFPGTWEYLVGLVPAGGEGAA